MCAQVIAYIVIVKLRCRPSHKMTLELTHLCTLATREIYSMGLSFPLLLLIVNISLSKFSMLILLTSEDTIPANLHNI